MPHSHNKSNKLLLIAMWSTVCSKQMHHLLSLCLHTHITHTQLLQQQVAGLAGQSAAYGQPSLGVSGLLNSPTSPTHGASPLSSNSSGTGLASPNLTAIPTLSSLPSLTNGLPALSPNGLSTSTDLQSPLHRYLPPSSHHVLIHWR